MELSECFELCVAVLNQSDKCFNTAFNSFLIKIFRVIKPQYLPEALLKYQFPKEMPMAALAKLN